MVKFVLENLLRDNYLCEKINTILLNDVEIHFLLFPLTYLSIGTEIVLRRLSVINQKVSWNLSTISQFSR